MPRTRQRILAAALMHPERAWYSADLARHLQTSRSSLQRELASLINAGVLKGRREGRMLYIQADTNCPVFPELRGLLSKTAGLIDVLREAIEPFADRTICAFVFGSIARAEEISGSDVDLMIVGDVGLRELAPSLQRAQSQIGREVNPKLYRGSELAKRLGAGDHFLLSVLGKPKEFIVGSQHDLDEIGARKRF